LIDSGSDPESHAGRQSDTYGGWYLELRRGEWYTAWRSGQIRIGIVEEQCFNLQATKGGGTHSLYGFLHITLVAYGIKL